MFVFKIYLLFNGLMYSNKFELLLVVCRKQQNEQKLDQSV